MSWTRGRSGRKGRDEGPRPGGTGPRPGGSPRTEPPSIGPVPPPGTVTREVRRLAPERAAHRLYVQVAWSTLDGLPLVAPDAREAAEARLIALCRRLDAEPVAIRASATGVALLLRVTPSHAVGSLATALKAGSEDALAAAGRPVRWARGFAASSVGPTEVRRTARRLGNPPGSDVRATVAFRGTNDLSRSASRPPRFPAPPRA